MVTVAVDLGGMFSQNYEVLFFAQIVTDNEPIALDPGLVPLTTPLKQPLTCAVKQKKLDGAC